VTLRLRVRFYQQLAVLVRAGVPLRGSLLRMKERIPGHQMAVLTKKINDGATVTDAFASAGFSPFECNLVAAGERSAHLETVFDHLAEYWKRQMEMSQALWMPLYYPLAVLHFAILIWSVVEMAHISWQVAMLHFVMRIGLLYLFGFILYVVARVSWPNPLAQRFWLFLPLIGKTLSTSYAYRWITAMRIEYSAGIPMPNAVADAWRASGCVGGERLAREGEAALRAGTDLSKLVQGWKRLPRDWIDFIETGEVSGALETAFVNLEAEAARAWSLAQQRMADWLPKIIYFGILLVIAAQVIFLFDQVVIDPINNAVNAIDNPGK